MALPVALNLEGRRVVSVGGGPVSAHRVGIFLEEGAKVIVVAPWLCEDLVDLVIADRITWIDRDYAGPEDLLGARFVHTATGDPATDARVLADSEDLGTWCVSAGSHRTTAAAVLARAKVDLPDGPVTLAVHASGDPARAVAVRNVLTESLETGSLPLQRVRPRQGPGWVALVGGGPGHDDLLTVRGRQLLAAADVVVVDRLAPHGVLEHLPATVRVIDVGKQPQRHAVPQAGINAILVEEALAGNAVVRLKGGDPYVLGRGGEERLACEAHGIPVEVVPGVTSAISVPAAAGIPVTHRGVARGFTVVTGHEDIPSLPTGGDHTLVLLMGVAALSRTAQLLQAHGRDPRCPVAIIERGWMPDQRVTIAALDEIATTADRRGVQSPAVIVVGEVVRLSPHFPDEFEPS